MSKGTAEPLRNRGLFAKAERVLTITGCSEQTRNGLVIYRLVDTEGLPSRLKVLTETKTSAGGEATTAGTASKQKAGSRRPLNCACSPNGHPGGNVHLPDVVEL